MTTQKEEHPAVQTGEDMVRANESKDTQVGLTPGLSLQAEDIKEAKRPDGLSEGDERKIQQKVGEVMKQLEAVKGRVEEEKLIDMFANIGLDSQERVATNTQIEQDRLGTLIDGNDEYSSQLKGEIERLDEVLEKFARDAADVDFVTRFVRKFPLVGKRLGKMAGREQRKRKTIREFCKSMEDRLRGGRTGLNQTNEEMKVVLGAYEKLQSEIKKQAYFAEVLAVGIQQLIARTQDLARQNILRNVHFHTVTRARDLRQYEESYEGYFATVRIGLDVNRHLISILTRLIVMGMPQMALGLVVRGMLVRQKEGIAAAKQTSETISNLYLANAKMIRDHVVAIGEFYKVGPIDPQKATEAYNQILEALVTLDRIKSEAIPQAYIQIEQSKKRAQELRERSVGTRATGMASLEIEEQLPSRPVGNTGRATI